jgi:RimJ/RimL family protein N-acetyltransferase
MSGGLHLGQDAYTEPVTLKGDWVCLEPLEMRQSSDLFRAAQDKEIWRYMPVPFPTSEQDVREWMQAALDQQARGQALPFAVVHRPSGRAIGSTRFFDISANDRHVEIGWTWLGKAYWHTPVNTECKYLLFTHAFETLGCIRVALKTDLRNERSQRAIERLGARREGILRRVVVTHDGFERSTVYYSVLDDEWPPIKAALEKRLYRAR